MAVLCLVLCLLIEGEDTLSPLKLPLEMRPWSLKEGSDQVHNNVIVNVH